jgi:uncharacterized protein YbjQ (UPF0145 family)
MVDIIVTESETIPSKKVVEILGNVSVKKVMWLIEDPEKLFQELRKQARVLGADAVISVVYRPLSSGIAAQATGIAVKLANESAPKCNNCNKELPEGNIAFCPHCGSSLS